MAEMTDPPENLHDVYKRFLLAHGWKALPEIEEASLRPQPEWREGDVIRARLAKLSVFVLTREDRRFLCSLRIQAQA